MNQMPTVFYYWWKNIYKANVRNKENGKLLEKDKPYTKILNTEVKKPRIIFHANTQR